MNYEDIEDAAVLSAAALISEVIESEIIKKDRAPVDSYLQGRGRKGRFAKDFEDLVSSPMKFKENFRMDVDVFNLLFSSVEPFLVPKRRTRPNDEITPKEKFAMILEYLACGSLQRHIASVYRVSKCYFGQILCDVCTAIIDALKDEIPNLTTAEMVNSANRYNYRWQFPNCVGAIDGKHVSIKCPKGSRSMFFNYKGYHSINLMAVADADYRALYCDVGAYGSEGDAGVFANSSLGKSLFEGSLPFPSDISLGSKTVPYFFVADDAFPLNKRILKPFIPRKSLLLEDEEAIFNYRLSRARRCVENFFGILCSRFYCLARTMFCAPDTAQKIVLTCCYLHNFLMRHSREQYCPSNYTDTYNDEGVLIEGEWRKKKPNDSLFTSTITFSHGRTSDEAKAIRNYIKQYVNSSSGAVTWQRNLMHTH